MQFTLNFEDLHQLYSQTPFAMAILDPDEKILEINDAFEALFQYKAEEVVGKKISKLIIPDDKGEQSRKFSDTVSNKKTVIAKTVRKRKDGKLVNVRIIGYPITKKGELKAIAVIYFNITKDVKIQKELEMKSKTLETLFISAPVGIFLINLTTKKITDANDKAVELFECSMEQLMSMHCYDIICKKDCELEGSFKTKFITREKSIKTLKGNTRTFFFNIAKVKIDGQEHLIETFIDITENKKKERNLLLLEKSMAQTAESIIVISASGDILFVNDAWVKLFGHKDNSKITEKGGNALLSDFLRNPGIQNLRKSLKQNIEMTSQMKFRRTDGSSIVINVSASIILDEHKEKIAEVFITRDVTEELESKRKIFESEQKYKAVAESALTGISTSDMDENIIFSNQAFADTLGYTVDELTGMNLADLIDEDEMEKIKNETSRRKEGDTSFYEGRLKRKDGKEIVLSVHASPLYNYNNQIEGTIAVTYDVTETAHARQILRENEEKLRTITSSVKDAILMMDHRGEISYWNDAASEIFGYSENEAIGQNLHTLLASEDDLEQHKKNFPQFLKSGKGNAVGKTLELTAIHKDGSIIPIELSLSSVKLKSRWNAVGVLRNISERKETERKIREARDQAIAASKYKSQFLANMSHEIRTPMNGIVGMTELLLGTELTEDQMEFANMIKSSAGSLLNLLNDFLDFSKIESGKMEIETIPFSLSEEINNALDSMIFKAHEKELELIVNVPLDVPDKLLGDPNRLTQVIINLITNAIKFTDEGEVSIRVSTFAKKKNHVDLLFVVTDTGIGIPREKQKSIFDAFSQADGSTTRLYGGSGLGLAISSRIVSLMGGEMWIESEVGKGSAFFFTSRFELQPVIKSKSEEHMPPRVSHKSVLIVDDNKTNRTMLNEIFKNFGFKTYTAPDGPQALDTLENVMMQKKEIDLIITDSEMPEMDGFEFIRETREHYNNDTRIIMMLTTSSGENIQKCKDIGVDAHISKPVNQSTLLDLLLTIFDEVISKPVATLDNTEIKKVSDGVFYNILLAEDNAINQKLAIRMLENYGHEVTLAKDGLEAYEKFRKGNFDLVLMDIQMPVMDGFEATSRIRNHEKSHGTHIPIIAMTAHALKGDEERCLAAGMDDYISKPINFQKLLSIIPGNVNLKGDKRRKTEALQTENELNYYHLMKQFGGNAQLLSEMISSFLEESTIQVEDIKQGIDDNNYEKVASIAHSLKGSLGIFTQKEPYKLLLEIESYAKTKNVADARNSFNLFFKNFTQFKRKLKQLGELENGSSESNN